MSDILIRGMEMPTGGYRTVEIGFDADGHPMALADGGDVFDVIPFEKNFFTNADYVRQMNDDEISEWYWWMLHYVQGYTDSRVALREWLKEEYKE